MSEPKLIQFSIPGKPIAQPRPRFSSFQGRAYNDPNHPVVAFKQAIALQYAVVAQGYKFEGAVELAICFNMVRIQNEVRQRVRMPGYFHTKKPDIDNLLKAVMDALTMADAWNDDSQVSRLIVKKQVEEGNQEPGTEIGLRAISFEFGDECPI